MFREDGYINMTKACQHFKKRAIDFTRLPGIQEYMDALADFLKVEKSHLLVSKPGRGGGTLMHPKMAVKLASWLDVRFEVWMHMTIENILKGHLQVSVAVPTQEALALKDTTDRLQARVLKLEEELKSLREGEIPADWMTAKVFLEESGFSGYTLPDIAYN